MILRLWIFILLVISFIACEKEVGPGSNQVEIRFKNDTAMFIDSVLLHISRETGLSKLSNLDIGEVTEYSEYKGAYFEMLPTVYSDTLVIPNSGAFDLLCCIAPGRYRVDIVTELDNGGVLRAYARGISEE